MAILQKTDCERYQEVIDEVTPTSENVLGFQMLRMQGLSNDVDGSNKVLFHYSIL